jgi:hypothetical protein
VHKIKAESIAALGELGLAGKRFDLVYIDGSHLAIDVYRDAVLSWPMVDMGGFVVFDDYQRKQGPAKDLPSVGIDAFLSAVNGEYEEVFRGHQIAIRKSR